MWTKMSVRTMWFVLAASVCWSLTHVGVMAGLQGQGTVRFYTQEHTLTPPLRGVYVTFYPQSNVLLAGFVDGMFNYHVSAGVSSDTYSEHVSIQRKRSFSNDEYTGEKARHYLTQTIFTDPTWYPSLYRFEAVHRLVAPAGLLNGVIKNVFDPSYTGFTEQIETIRTEDGNLKQDIYRLYTFNITNDNTKRYTPKQLNKLYTPTPEHTNTATHPHLAHALTPVRGITLKLKESTIKMDVGPNAPVKRFLYIVYMRLYSTEIDARAHVHEPEPSSLIVALEDLTLEN
eukprot:GDKI01008362.1.p1 GENE.GDKI01008362.1~~GDKI01008362.1.p1  ORF type:complete len:286 (-),score=61.86 GDKI01008362.1:26-883(-)